MNDDTLALQDLCDRAQVSTRTVRYYIQQGLLPPADRAGPGATYGQEHLDRLRLIRMLKDQHLPLSKIRRRLESLSPEDVLSLVKGSAPIEAESAADYVRAVLTGTSDPILPPTRPGQARTPGRSTWERYSLTPEIELHVKRPLSRVADRRLKTLLQHARDLYSKEEP